MSDTTSSLVCDLVSSTWHEDISRKEEGFLVVTPPKLDPGLWALEKEMREMGVPASVVKAFVTLVVLDPQVIQHMRFQNT